MLHIHVALISHTGPWCCYPCAVGWHQVSRDQRTWPGLTSHCSTGRAASEGVGRGLPADAV